MYCKLVLLLLSLLPFIAAGQECTTLGQTPSTAFPVCGTTKFKQETVPLCGGKSVPGCANYLTDINPFWYKFTCFADGTLGFEITPSNLSDDYDWQLFDITGRNPMDLYTDKTMFVAGNWSGEGGVTGASSRGTSLDVCAGPGQPLFTSMPQLKKNHEYLLLVSHFTSSQSGYALEFKGGTANITDPLPPDILSAIPDCASNRISVVLNKKMRCNSLAADGSDFSIPGSNATILEAKSSSCSAGFDMDTVVLLLDRPLTNGDYQVVLKAGSDGNTLLDNCGTGIPEGNAAGFSIRVAEPTLLDSITPPSCAPNQLELVFNKPIICSTIAANGSDFSLSGPAAVSITGAQPVCNSEGRTTVIRLTLSGILASGGNYTVTSRVGSDGNTIRDDCGLYTPPGSQVSARIEDTVSADLSMVMGYGCVADTLYLSNAGNNGINQWRWSVSGMPDRTVRQLSMLFTSPGEKQGKLWVSNGFCADSSSFGFTIPDKLKAAFQVPDNICPKDGALFTDSSLGMVSSWYWDFGNGNTSTLQQPPVEYYPASVSDTRYTVSLTVKGNGCESRVSKTINVVNSCEIAVPSAFSPNGDGRNDELYPANAYKASQLLFRVYNRYGQVVFESKDISRRWNGRVAGKDLAAGTYVWTLQYTLRDTGQSYHKKGTVFLLR